MKGLCLLTRGLVLIATAKAEVAENLVRFGAADGEFMGRTRLFIPFLL